MKINWKTKLLSFVLFVFVLTGCYEKKTYYDIDFIVQNNCGEQIRVDYSIRICSSIDNGCSPHDFSDLISQDHNIELYVRDNISDDGNIEDVFYKLDIFKGEKKSNVIFWNTEKLVETKYDNKVEYVLTVDATFFQ